MYFGCVCFRGEIGFLNCDDICMCVVKKQFELIDSFMLTWSMMRVISLLLLGPCPCVVSIVVWSVCEVVMEPYVDAAVAVTVMRVLLIVLHVCLLRECDGAKLTAMLVWRMDEVR